MKRSRLFKFIIPATVVLVLAGSAFAIQVWKTRAAPGIVGMEKLEERWGIQITMLAVTADGGMLDLRYRMVDPTKVIDLQELETKLVFIVEKNGYTFRPVTPMRHSHDAQIGLIYSMLYYNQNGMIQPGDLVTIQLGDVRVQHVPAR